MINVKEPVEQYCDAISNFEDKLGMAFLQLHDNFKPKDFERLKIVINEFPKVIPLGVEVRNTEWFTNPAIANEFAKLFEDNGIANIIVDTSGRRDMLHMRLPHQQLLYVLLAPTMMKSTKNALTIGLKEL